MIPLCASLRALRTSRWPSSFRLVRVPQFLLFLLLPVMALAEVSLPPLHHPVDIVPSDQLQRPEKLELGDNGQLVCASCHQAPAIEQWQEQPPDSDADDFLVGGPYATLTDFCYRCHRREQYQRPNIHRMLDAEGAPIESACRYCHEEVPDRDNPDPAKTKLRLALADACYGCHLENPHLNVITHQVAVPQAMAERIAANEPALNVTLPLDQGRVVCVTCHTPHQHGVIDPAHPAGRQVADGELEEGIGYRPSRWQSVVRADKTERLARLGLAHQALGYGFLERELLLRLPAKDGSLCLACHRFED